MKTLLAGWFSFDQMGATAGDIMACDIARGWLESAGHTVDIAVAPPFTGGVNWQTVDPSQYTQVAFVCGPFGDGWPITEFLARFSTSRLIGLNLSVIEPLEVWNPFGLLLERDSSRASRPEIVFISDQPKVPVVGVVLVHAQLEYKSGRLHQVASDAIRRLIDSRPMATVVIDTRLDVNAMGLRNAAEVESLIARMDVILTTRLHGTVLALKNGVPAIAIDPIVGGAKIRRQADNIGWPVCFDAGSLTDKALAEAFAFCLTQEARALARDCAARARGNVAKIRDEFIAAVRV
jgi:Polysaccharide pyruvyl transferase